METKNTKAKLNPEKQPRDSESLKQVWTLSNDADAVTNNHRSFILIHTKDRLVQVTAIVYRSWNATLRAGRPIIYRTVKVKHDIYDELSTYFYRHNSKFTLQIASLRTNW